MHALIHHKAKQFAQGFVEIWADFVYETQMHHSALLDRINIESQVKYNKYKTTLAIAFKSPL